MTDEQRVLANKINALQSTGPRTPAGKRTSSSNALKHGILAREAVIHGKYVSEDAEAFRALLADLWRDLGPAGRLEELLVERIVVTFWRLRRVLVAERGAILSTADAWRWQNALNQGDQLLEMREASAKYGERHYSRTAFGTRYLIDLLLEAKEVIGQTGSMTHAIWNRVAEVFGSTDFDGFANILLAVWRVSEEQCKELPEAAQQTRVKSAVLTIIEDKIRRLETIHEALAQKEAADRDAAIQSRHLPDSETVERLTRYETALERQLYRALAQLERLQRQRRGEPVPPPVSVDLTTPA